MWQRQFLWLALDNNRVLIIYFSYINHIYYHQILQMINNTDQNSCEKEMSCLKIPKKSPLTSSNKNTDVSVKNFFLRLSKADSDKMSLLFLTYSEGALARQYSLFKKCPLSKRSLTT
ncbi:hypothetical protein BpHYR1_017334 [Brachionus plicatilis]|uniref:Uncharacterized protein n=1 Tax=Brachionus plicatilis TaxID=10195 RepID=A0A3M7Q088_BRAPC|nr:hypothetical protein BpHYR1_017334 [Brachionus plicatilis]